MDPKNVPNEENALPPSTGGGEVRERPVTWTAGDGIRLKGRDWAPAGGGEWAVVALMHGMGEHSGRFADWAEALAGRGVAVTCLDQRGHGRSEGPRGHSPGYGWLMESVDGTLREAAERHPGVPVFLMGHSMGGNLALNYGLGWRAGVEEPGLARRVPEGKDAPPVVAGLIASAPWLELAFKPNPVQVALARVVRGVFPRFTQSTNLDVEAISRDPEQVRAYILDPLIHDRITASMFFDVHAQGEWAMRHAGELATPTFLYHGDADRLTSFEASRRFAAAAGDNVRFTRIEGGFHETHHELEPVRNRLLDDLPDWMKQQA